MRKERERGITLGALTIVLIAMSIILVLALIKIYLSNRIYFESRLTHMLEQEVAALREENTLLQMRVEKLKYKSQISDTIFSLDESKTENDIENLPQKE
jgi:cell division protein FtsL